MRDMFYGHAPLVNGLFLMNLERNVTHVHSVNTKRCKFDNDSPTYLWHCRLGHISVKPMKKVHADGLLDYLDYESFDTCEPCLMGKNDQDTIVRNNVASNQLIGNYTYRCVR